MQKTIEFFMAMIPPTKTAQQQKIKIVNGKPIVYKPKELADTKNKLMANLSKFRPKEKITTGCRLVVKWCFPRGKSHRNGEYRTSKPDTDNLQKLLKDCMTECGFFADDALVASEVIEKFWADIPGIYIKIEVLGND